MDWIEQSDGSAKSVVRHVTRLVHSDDIRLLHRLPHPVRCRPLLHQSEIFHSTQKFPLIHAHLHVTAGVAFLQLCRLLAAVFRVKHLSDAHHLTLLFIKFHTHKNRRSKNKS